MSNYSTRRLVEPSGRNESDLPRYSGDAVAVLSPAPTQPLGVALLVLVPPGIAIWAFLIFQVASLLGY